MTASPDADQETSRAADLAVLTGSVRHPERFEALFDRYYPEIRRYVHSRLGAVEAEDIASETFLVAFRDRRRFDGSGPGGRVRAWLYGIATNLIRRHHRGEERRYRAMGRYPVEPPDPGHDERVVIQISTERIRGELARSLAALSTKDRDVLLLTALGGLTSQEIATALKIPYGTVCSRLNRVRRKMRAVLDLDATLPE